jgi:hypothetical protein
MQLADAIVCKRQRMRCDQQRMRCKRQRMSLTKTDTPDAAGRPRGCLLDSAGNSPYQIAPQGAARGHLCLALAASGWRPLGGVAPLWSRCLRSWKRLTAWIPTCRGRIRPPIECEHTCSGMRHTLPHAPMHTLLHPPMSVSTHTVA